MSIPDHYRKFVESKITDYIAATQNLCDVEIHGPRNPNLHALHCAVGLSTEGGEVLDAHRGVFYKDDFRPDIDNIIEELGDCLFYITALMNHYNISLAELMKHNVAKLNARYSDRATGKEFTDRDLEKERAAIARQSEDEAEIRALGRLAEQGLIHMDQGEDLDHA